MAAKKGLPTNLIEAIRYFADVDIGVEFVAKMRWPNGPVCPRCKGTEHSYLSTRRTWKCKSCQKQFSVKVGTIFQDSPLGLDKWLPAVWLVANSKNGISSHELGRSLGVTQKSAWFMLHRIRLAMQTGSFNKLTGEIEADETYVGGKARNMHASKRKARGYMGGRSASGKTAVAGLIERGGIARASVVPDVTGATLKGVVRDNVATGSTVYTDNWKAYFGLSEDYAHEVIDHAEQYVDGRIHTNGIENFWSLLKRGLHGTYVSVAPFHLFRYLDERVFAYNLRDRSDYGRFRAVLGAVSGHRVTYAELTGRV